MRRISSIVALFVAAPTFLAVVGCDGDATPFNEIDRLRVLGIRADRPWLLPTETANVDFLAVNNDPDLAGVELRSRWHFCPLQADSTIGFECVIQSAEDLETITGTATADLLTGLDFEFSEFGLFLGNGDSVQVPFLIPAETLRQTCEALDGIELPPFVTRPQCEGRFPVTIFLELGAPVADDPTAIDNAERVVSFRDLELIYDEELEPNTPNQNPTIDSFEIARNGTEMFVDTSSTSTVPLRFDTTYDLRVTVNDSESETVMTDDDDEPDRESLFITWFIEGGETDSSRTGFLPADDDDFSDLDRNEWTTPRRTDFDRDPPNIQLFLVIRDNRGGLSWLVRTFELNDAEGL